MMIEINIGKEFSDDPSGRYYTDGEGSGEEFREEVLLPAIKQATENKEKIRIILDDDVDGYGSSFLVEAFAGVVKYGHMKAEQLTCLLDFSYKDADFEFFAQRSLEYIRNAKFNSDVYRKTKSE